MSSSISSPSPNNFQHHQHDCDGQFVNNLFDCRSSLPTNDDDDDDAKTLQNNPHQTLKLLQIFDNNFIMMLNIIKLLTRILNSPTILLFIMIIASYWPTFMAEFVFDDYPAIIKNNDLRTDKTSWSQLWFNDYWGMPLKSVNKFFFVNFLKIFKNLKN